MTPQQSINEVNEKINLYRLESQSNGTCWLCRWNSLVARIYTILVHRYSNYGRPFFSFFFVPLTSINKVLARYIKTFENSPERKQQQQPASVRRKTSLSDNDLSAWISHRLETILPYKHSRPLLLRIRPATFHNQARHRLLTQGSPTNRSIK